MAPNNNPPEYIYAVQMARKGDGHALWEPDYVGTGSYCYPVEIGDVGYIHKGAFIRLFNTDRRFKGRNQGGSKKFATLTIGESEVQERRLPADQPIQAREETNRKVQANISMQTGAPTGVQVGGNLLSLGLDKSNTTGAVLFMKEDAIRKDLLSKGKFIRHMCENYQSWLKFANGPGWDRKLKAFDLIFATGCDKTTGWGCVAYSQLSTDHNVSFGPTVNAGIVSLQVSAKAQNERKVIDSPFCNYGPERYVRSPNQCVFLRGYKICKRPGWLTRKYTKDGFEVIAAGMKSLFLGPQERKEQLVLPYNDDPLNSLTRYSFEKTKADYSLVHHDDLKGLLKDTPEHEKIGNMDEWLGQKNPPVYTVNLWGSSVGVFKDTHEVIRTYLEEEEAEEEEMVVC